MNNEFTLTDENSKTRSATPLLKISLNNQEYLVYRIRRDDNSDNLFVSQINSNNNNIVTLKVQIDKDSKDQINNIIKDILEEILVTGKINSEKLPADFTISSFSGQVEASKFTITESYLFTSSKDNISKLSQATNKFTEEQQKQKEENIPKLDISKESNLQQALETTLFPEEIHPSATSKAPIDFPTSAPGPAPVNPSPIIFEPQEIKFTPSNSQVTNNTSNTGQQNSKETSEQTNKSVGITFIDRTFNPDPNACDRINEKDSTVLATTSQNVRAFRNNIQQLSGQHTSEEISQSLGHSRTLKPQKKGLPFPTSTAGYITTAAIVIVGLIGVATASFFITLSILQK